MRVILLRRGARDGRGSEHVVFDAMGRPRGVVDRHGAVRHGPMDGRGRQTQHVAFQKSSRRFAAVLDRNIKEGRPVSKVAMVGSAMTTLKAKLEQRAAALIERIGALDKAGDEKFALADHHLTAHETELAEMETELRQLGNFPPLAGSAGNSGG